MGGITIGIDKPSFLVNSTKRISGTNEIFNYRLDLNDTGHSYDQVALTSVTIPKSYYNLSYDSLLVLTENGVDINIPFARGDYNIQNLMHLTIQYLNNASLGGYTYTMTLPDPTIEIDTRKFTFTTNAPVGIPITLTASADTRLHHFLGFVEGNVNTFVDVAGTLTLESPRIYDLEHTKFIIIKSDIGHNTGNLDSDTEVLARIPITNPSHKIIHYRLISLEDEIKTLYDPDKNVFSFGLYDDEDRLLNLNGADWSLTLFVARHNYHDEVSINHIKIENIEKLL